MEMFGLAFTVMYYAVLFGIFLIGMMAGVLLCQRYIKNAAENDDWLHIGNSKYRVTKMTK